MISNAKQGAEAFEAGLEAHLERRDTLIRNCNSLPEVGASKQADLEIVLANSKAVEDRGITFSSNVSVARTLSALEYVILLGVYTSTMGCQWCEGGDDLYALNATSRHSHLSIRPSHRVALNSLSSSHWRPRASAGLSTT